MIGNDEPIASEPGEVVTTGAEWYDYEAKYTEGGMELVVPAPISAAQRERVRRIARRGVPAQRRAPGWRGSTSS